MSGTTVERTTLRLHVNGQQVEADVPASATLQQALHDALGRREVRYGCGEGACGACAVLLDGEAVASCLLLAAQAEGAEVTTAAGLDAEPLRTELVAQEAFQCGYCACGMLVSAAHHLSGHGDATPDAVRRALAGNLCRCTGYTQIVEAVASAATARETAPADGWVRGDLRDKLDGTAVYPTDGRDRRALVGAVLWSEHPSARITALDVRAAEAVPGVAAVLTWRDVPGRNLATTTIFGRDQPLLARDRVRSMGDAIALVAADDERAAREALGKISVVYEELDAVTDIQRAMEPGAPSLGGSGNVIVQFVESRGDVAAAFRGASRIVEGSYRCAATDHGSIELEGGTGWLEGERIMLDVHCQTPFTVRRGVARALGVRTDDVAVVATRAGGAFGKYLMPTVDGLVALLVHRTRRPVRLVLGRDEVLMRRPKRHDVHGRYRLALDGDGGFLGIEVDLLVDAGPYRALTPTVVAVLASEATGAYEFPAFFVRARGVLTNNLLSAPERGYGSQQANFGIECIVAKAARTLAIDPIALRRRNVSARHGPGVAATLERAAARLGAPPQAEPGWVAGRGIATISAKYGYPAGFLDRTLARLSVDGSGRFTVETDIVDAGTGVTVQAQRLAAEALELDALPDYEVSHAALADPTGRLLAQGQAAPRWRLAVYHGLEGIQLSSSSVLVKLLAGADPGVVRRVVRTIAWPTNVLASGANWLKSMLFPYGIDSYNPRTSGSRGTLMTGRAVLDAAERLRAAARAMGARRLEVSERELAVDGRGVHVAADPARALTWSELASASGGRLAAVGRAALPRHPLLDPSTGSQKGPIDVTPATHVVDLAVQPESGQVRILGYLACHDLGRILSPRIVRGQVLGGIAMGVGQALLERLRVEGGRVRSTGLRDYLVPTSLDVPPEVELELLELGDGLGPRGAKGIGEAPAVAAPAAIANALYDALGEQVTEIPATPDLIARLARQEQGFETTPTTGGTDV
jgi:CO/xanthine dehydrogenase Mo-binding subunit/aerobic-type carbon monoxide dehydrogenase small subunit (CoxS/CutS family)